MARIDPLLATRFGQESDPSNNIKFILASLPLAIVIFWFLVEAYQRPQKPFYNLGSHVSDDAVVRQAADESGSFVPLMDMCLVVLSFMVAWACLACYWLGFQRAQAALVNAYLDHGKAVLGNIVYQRRCWACEFRYYGYVSYHHPHPPLEDDDANTSNNGQPVVLHKKTRIFEPYTRELVPILILPGYPCSGQGKQDLEFAKLAMLQNRPSQIFLGQFCLCWTLVCALVPIYLLHQMKIIDDRQAYSGITDDYDNATTGWIVYGIFMGVGLVGLAMGGNVLLWYYTRWWMLHQATSSKGDISLHGLERPLPAAAAAKVAVADGDDYQRI